jgi:hypothetical protein
VRHTDDDVQLIDDRGWILSEADEDKLNIMFDVMMAKRDQILKFVNDEQISQMRREFQSQIRVRSSHHHPSTPPTSSSSVVIVSTMSEPE